MSDPIRHVRVADCRWIDVSAPCAAWPNEIGFQQRKCGRGQLLRVFPHLPIEGGMVMRIKPTLVREHIPGAVMEMRSDAQCG